MSSCTRCLRDTRWLCRRGNALLQQKTLIGRKHSSLHKDSQKQTLNEEELIEKVHEQIRNELVSNAGNIEECSHYYFDNEGKLFRPMIIALMAKAINANTYKDESIFLESQRKMVMVCEMLHTASLFHDDVIDGSQMRRNKPSVNQLYSNKNCIFAGDFIVGTSTVILSKCDSMGAIENTSNILVDLVKGEMMQMSPKQDIDQRFNNYLLKSFRKTASLIAYCCKSAALLGDASEAMQQKAFEYGKNLGIAFQLVDDALDITSTTEALGKPTGADMQLGLATAPVLFAAQKHPELHALIDRRFNKGSDDIKQALEYVHKSDGIGETFLLARQYATAACNTIKDFDDSLAKHALINFSNRVVNRRR